MSEPARLAVVGDKEVEAGLVAVRTRGGDDLGTMTFDDFCDHLHQDVASYGRSAEQPGMQEKLEPAQ